MLMHPPELLCGKAGIADRCTGISPFTRLIEEHKKTLAASARGIRRHFLRARDMASPFTVALVRAVLAGAAVAVFAAAAANAR
jgi:hypothetical protein